MPQVEYLDLSDNGLSENSLVPLTNARNLRLLRVADVRISEQTVAHFRDIAVCGKED